MNYKILIAASLVAATVAMAGTPTPLPQGWISSGQSPAAQNCDVLTDTIAIAGSKRSLSLRCAKNEVGFVTVMQQFRADDYRGQRVRFSAKVRADNVEQWGGLWMRVDEERSPGVAFDNMQSRPIKGTVNWKRYEVVLDVSEKASGISFGMLMSGKGQMWMDEINIEPVGKDVAITSAPASSNRKPVNLDLSQ